MTEAALMNENLFKEKAITCHVIEDTHLSKNERILMKIIKKL